MFKPSVKWAGYTMTFNRPLTRYSLTRLLRRLGCGVPWKLCVLWMKR